MSAPYWQKTLCIFVSQSGETADTLAALRLAKEKGCTTIAIANVLGSTISREADATIYTCAGPEIAVASTKAYTTQVIVLILLAMYIAQTLGKENEIYKDIIKGIARLPEQLEEILKDEPLFEKYAERAESRTRCLYRNNRVFKMSVAFRVFVRRCKCGKHKARLSEIIFEYVRFPQRFSCL